MKIIVKRLFKILVPSLLFLLLAAAVFMCLRGQSISECTYSVPSRTGDHVRIVALADLHGELPEEKQDKFAQRIRSLFPDLIVYLGDMIDCSTPVESADVLESLTERLIRIAPVCYVDGNHEQTVRAKDPDIYMSLNDALTEAGAVQLDNNTVRLLISEDPDKPAEWISGQLPLTETPVESAERESGKASADEFPDDPDGTIVNICGITTHYYWGQEESALVSDLSGMDGINVLLCHYPESVIWYDAFDSGGLDLAICGHTHGGLIRLPFLGGFYAPEQGRWPLYDQGRFPIYTDTTWGDYGGSEGSDFLGTMIISGGLAGEHGVPRINNPKEISVIDTVYTRDLFRMD